MNERTPVTPAGVDELNHLINLAEALRDGTLTPGDPDGLHAVDISAQVRRIEQAADRIKAMQQNGSLMRPRGEGWD
jgi:hypothetical protein